METQNRIKKLKEQNQKEAKMKRKRGNLFFNNNLVLLLLNVFLISKFHVIFIFGKIRLHY